MKVDIQGTGPIAMALALFLLRQGIRPASIALTVPDPTLPTGPAARAIALSDGSWQLLGRIIEPPSCAPIKAVDIGVIGHGLHSRLTPADLRLRALGRVVRYGELWRALASSCARAGLGAPAAGRDESSVLHVVADGRINNIEDTCEFDQSALTAELNVIPETGTTRVRAPLPGIAYERFKPDGPIALLPLPEDHRVSLVWCDRPARCEALQSMDEQQFAKSLAACLGPRFKPMTLAGPRESTALRRLVARHEPADVLVIGNAAQALHPVAGQGMNLGLRDAFEAASAIGDAALTNLPATELVKQFIFRRTADRDTTIRLTDMLAQLSERPHLSGLNNGATRSIAIALLDTIAPLRISATKCFVFGHRSGH